MTRKYTRNINILRRTQGCLTDSVAYILNLHPEKVPYFVYPRQSWNERLKKFFKKHGYKTEWKICTQKTIPKTGTHLLVGNSLIWKTAGHAVVYKKGKLAYDPNFPSKWNDARVTHKLVLKKIKQ